MNFVDGLAAAVVDGSGPTAPLLVYSTWIITPKWWIGTLLAMNE